MSDTTNAGSVDHLLKYLAASPTAFHAASATVARLQEAGFKALEEGEQFNLEPGGAYYVRRGDASVIAFRTGRKPVRDTGFAVVGAHTDSPSLRVKFPLQNASEGYRSVPVEVYGGPILSTWLDRSLGLAGRVVVRTDTGMRSVLVRTEGTVATIPNAAIHLNREINKGFEYNKQDHLAVILGSEAVDLHDLVSSLAEAKTDEVLDADLYFFDSQLPLKFGKDGEFYTSGRIDNLAGCFAALEGLCTAQAQDHCQIACLFDNEEVGSRTAHGADSGFLRSIMDRVVIAGGGSADAAYAARARSFLISNDGAHAVHPSYAAKHDPGFKPTLNGGPVIKISGGRRYTSDASSSARFAAICEAVGVPVQRFYNRSDMASGSTIGPIASSRTEIPSVDVGVPMLAMHSIRETGGSSDAQLMVRALRQFYTEGP